MKILNNILYVLEITTIIMFCGFLIFMVIMFYKLNTYNHCNNINFLSNKCEKYIDF